MDLIENRTRQIGAMALDGLYERSKAISANTVNALTPNYQRKEVTFEKSLQSIIQKEDEKESIKLQNSAKFAQDITQEKPFLLKQTPEQIAFLNSCAQDDFSVEIQNDTAEPLSENGNNVNIESEMMDEARNGMQYQIIANLMSKSYAQLNSVIKGQNQ